MRFVALLVIGLFTTVSANAAPIAVTNGDFEDPSITLGQANIVNGVDLGSFAFSAAGWSFNGIGGTFAPTQGGVVYLDTPEIDERVGFITSGSMAYQTLGVAIEDGYDYLLSTMFGHRFDVAAFSGVFGFFAGDPTNVIASVAIDDPAPGTFSLQTMTVLSTSLDNFIGEELGVFFLTTAGQLNFDNVDVERIATNEIVTPLPAAVWLFGSVLLAGGGCLRRKKLSSLNKCSQQQSPDGRKQSV